jgi:hypothetical protein
MRGPRHLRLGLAAVVLAIELATALTPAAGAQSLIRDYPVPGGWFYSQESRDPAGPPFRGYTVVDDTEASFWTEFRRYGGVEVLGYPLSRRYRYPAVAGFVSQAFQRGILQWHPDTGRAELANVFEQFGEQGLDDQLEIAGLPKPLGSTGLGFAEDAELRMGWLTEPRFLARYFFDPVYQVPFETQEEAWAFFGLAQTAPERPVYYRERLNGKWGAPLYLPYVVQRFQKGGLQLFLDDVAVDPTIVPGDGRRGCISLTAVGRLARRLGAGKLLPSVATLPEPVESPPRVHMVASVPPTTSQAQTSIQFELIGTGFDPGEPVTIRLVPQPNSNQLSTPLQPVVSRVDAADADGSFDQLVTARIATYTVTLTGEKSHKTLDASQDSTLNLAQSSDVFTASSSKATYC